MNMHLLLIFFYLFYYDVIYVIFFECNLILMFVRLSCFIESFFHQMTFYYLFVYEWEEKHIISD
jgi:hypothetical protein